MKRLLFLATFLFTATLFAQNAKQLFNSAWKDEEFQNLEKGEIVIRNIRKMKKATIQKNVNPLVDEMLLKFTEVNPSYLAEIIYKMPKKDNQSVIQQAVDVFSNIDLYKEIIYTDDRKGKSKNLFPKAEVKERKDSPEKICIATHLKMDMLSGYDSELVIKHNNAGFYFEQHNTTPLKWKGITAVKSGNMDAGICCFEYGDSYYVYALGGINAPRIPIVLYEIERQFIGRIEDFTIFFIKKFDIKR